MPAVSVRLPAEMERDARRIAQARNETVADVLRHALAQYLTDISEEADDARFVREMEARRAAGLGHAAPMEEVWTELDALEAQGALPDFR